MTTPEWVTLIAFAVHWSVVIGLWIRVIMRRRPVGVSLAWLILIVTVPAVGAIAYLMLGELRLGVRRERRAAALAGRYTGWVESVAGHVADDRELPGELLPIARQAQVLGGLPPMSGNDLTLLDGCERVLRTIIQDIDAARRVIGMEFYIWENGGTADEVLAAVIRAAQRGVTCRLLLDSIGSGPFFKSAAAATARAAGVRIVEALPARVLRTIRRRQDLRLHRKIIAIDDRIAYTGSLNIVDARLFKQTSGCGPWVDAMVRVMGPAVAQLESILLYDWEVETGEDLCGEYGFDAAEPGAVGPSIVQTIPSGPGPRSVAAYRSLIGVIYAARRRLTVVSPYFVPDETIETALISAVERGVQVTVIIPACSDSRLVQMAAHACLQPLLDAGVRIARYRTGLLHTKSVSVDDRVALIGSVNLDARSFWLNYEVTLAVYDTEFVGRLEVLQDSYLADSEFLDAAAWRRRGFGRRLAENTVRLFSPIL